ncbi:hypothetical protein [Alloacidobacterium sp.]|uniref:hypothetical protein n=1 Tax=Alloacidobacterium sp. TaxID=2951999 RepID=UPI002D512749|nr:hypothetical protein [Alloacidobacterium sp.]HYK34816.1 hypothetical protein [Alloacidobacterium sp.]
MAPRGHRNGQAHTNGIPNIDSLVNFNNHFQARGVDQNGNTQVIWYYNMVGTAPEHHGTTTLNAPIVPVTLDLRNFDGSPRFVNGQPLISSPAQFVQPTVDSPVFQNFTYSSSNDATQLTDAVQRAEFFDRAKPDWHTLLNPSVKTGRTMVLIRGTYRFALNADGSCCAFVLVDANTFGNALFPSTYPFDNSTPVGAAENTGDITTQDISTFLFPNTYLYVNGDPNQCCILGYHTYDLEPGIPSNGNLERRYVLNYSSWISPGLFGGGFEDVTALSHEVAETFNDPFVASDGIRNITPWWLSPNGNCQNNLEVGDVIEGLPEGVYPITMNGMTYHPQNEALLQWFEFEAPSSAISGAYSYPNIGTLTALSPPEGVNCK